MMEGNDNHVEVIQNAFLVLTENFLKSGTSLAELQSISIQRNDINTKRTYRVYHTYVRRIFIALIVPVFCGILIKYLYTDVIIKTFHETRCLVQNNYFIWEFTRPVSDCSYCRNVNGPLILPNMTKTQFQPYAYTSRPVIVKNGASHWLAAKAFNFHFFKNLYEHIDGAYETVEEECQFLHFKSNFSNLREVFAMTEQRAMNPAMEDSWYVGWKNCHPQILDVMTKFYDSPHFLPDDAEIPYTNYVFLGYGEGAIMHLDYISRLMWQGQVIGNKVWIVAPTPECDHVCNHFNFSVNTGDIVLLDTRIWYHGTYTENGSFSLTVASEYG